MTISLSFNRSWPSALRIPVPHQQQPCSMNFLTALSKTARAAPFLIAESASPEYPFPDEEPDGHSFSRAPVRCPEHPSLERRWSPGHCRRGISPTLPGPPSEGGRNPEVPPRLREMERIVYRRFSQSGLGHVHLHAGKHLAR